MYDVSGQTMAGARRHGQAKKRYQAAHFSFVTGELNRSHGRLNVNRFHEMMPAATPPPKVSRHTRMYSKTR